MCVYLERSPEQPSPLRLPWNELKHLAEIAGRAIETEERDRRILYVLRTTEGNFFSEVAGD